MNVETFWSRADRSAGSDHCWRWLGTHTPDGYGRYKTGGKQNAAHRVAYELLVGPIPDGKQIDHLCRVRDCVNPAHMEPVTNRVNQLRGDTFARRNAAATHCPRGHAYDRANTEHNKNGSRVCRTCRKAKFDAWRRSSEGRAWKDAYRRRYFSDPAKLALYARLARERRARRKAAEVSAL